MACFVPRLPEMTTFSAGSQAAGTVRGTPWPQHTVPSLEDAFHRDPRQHDRPAPGMIQRAAPARVIRS